MTNKVYEKTIKLLSTGCYNIYKLSSYDKKFYTHDQIIIINKNILEITEDNKKYFLHRKHIKYIKLMRTIYNPNILIV